MNRRGIVRIQIILLLVVVVGFFIRWWIGSPGREGVVVFEDLKLQRLYTAHIQVEKPSQFAVNAIGSYENSRDLAVYGWIVHRPSGDAVWKMTTLNSSKGKNEQAVLKDTLQLDAGYYSVYFTTYGDPDIAKEGTSAWYEWFGDDARKWHADGDDWFFQLAELNSSGMSQAVKVSEHEVPGRFTNRIGNDDFRRSHSGNYRFAISKNTPVTITALGDFPPGSNSTDQGFISSVSTGRRVWEWRRSNTVAAGGAKRNRISVDSLVLAPGLYEMEIRSAYNHYPDEWMANPPIDPMAWGLNVTVDSAIDLANVGEFNIWGLPRLVDLTGIGNSEEVTQQFTIDSPARIYVYGLGEIMSSTAYDYGWIQSNVTNSRIWSMEDSNTSHAGGDDKNQYAEQFIDLPAGSYTAFYVSDGSHAYSSWNGREPDFPERWGLTVILLDSTITHSSANQAGSQSSLRPESAANYKDAELLVDISYVGNDQEILRSMVLTEDTDLHIVAVGECIGDWYDFGAIVSTANGMSVWEMTENNTLPAGGTDKNRKFDGVIRLPAGNYSVRYQTDSSHAWGNFDGLPPSNPNAWGIQVWKAIPVNQ